MLMPSLAKTLVRNRSLSNWYQGDKETFYLRLQTFTMMYMGICASGPLRSTKWLKLIDISGGLVTSIMWVSEPRSTRL